MNCPNHSAYGREPNAEYYCKICDTYIKCKGFPIHLKKHNITYFDYVKDNLELFIEYGWKLCVICNKTPTQGVTCGMECFGKLQSRRCTGRVFEFTPERRKEINESISAAKKGKRLGISPQTYMTPDAIAAWKQNISKSHKGKRTGINPWERMDEETAKNAKKKISAASSSRMTPEHIQRIFKNKNITKIEQVIYDFLIANNIEFTFQYFISSESRHSYDFKIKGINLIIEVDGDYWHGGPGVKKWCKNIEQNRINDAMKNRVALERGITVIRFWGSDIKTNSNKVFDQILYEIQQRKTLNDSTSN